MRAQPLAQANVEHALQIIYPLGHGDDLLKVYLAARHPGENVHVVLHVMWNFGGFGALRVFGIHHIIPGQLAEATQAEPGAPHGEVVQRLGLVLKSGQLIVHHVHEDEPGLVVLRPFVGERITALLCERFLRHVHGILHALVLHADVVQELRIGAVVLDEVGFGFMDAQSDDLADPFAARQLVERFQGRRRIPEGQLQPAGLFPVENAGLVTLHQKAHGVAEGDRVNAVGVAIEVEFEDRIGVEDATRASDRADGLVLRPVHDNLLPFVGAGLQLEAIHGMGAGHGAAVPAAIGQALREALFPIGAVNLMRLWMRAEFEVVDRQQIVVAHDAHQIGGAAIAHPVLDGIPGGDFLLHVCAHARETLRVGGMIGVAVESVGAHDQGFDMLVAQHRAGTATRGLFVADGPPLAVVEAEVEAAQQRVLCPRAGGDHGDVVFLFGLFGERFIEPRAEEMGVGRRVRQLLDGDLAGDGVHHDDDVLSCNALHFDCVPTAELEQRPEVPPGVAVGHNIRGR
ncbi:MAG: hypothetical protein BWY25_01364 [Chloroflexi bacterium ADurb.Bin222]|nr:MAG: hypothetical protein BWY25_01364 [Chloroflexi bacterium ADurb.Bin222]